MYSVRFQEGVPLYVDVAYPIIITNAGSSIITVTVTAVDTTFSNNIVQVPANGETTIYASTHKKQDVLTFNDESNNPRILNFLGLDALENVEWGDSSYITIMESPGPTEEEPVVRIYVLERHEKLLISSNSKLIFKAQPIE